MPNSFHLEKCTDKAVWDDFVANSPQGNVFCLSYFLDALKRDYHLWVVKENGQIHLGAVIVKDEEGEVVNAPVPFSTYQGILFSPIYEKAQLHSGVADALKTVDFLLLELEKKYNRIFFSLHHRVGDLRSFMWFNYHQPERGQFRLNLQYTGIISLGVISNFEDYLQRVRTTRRYEYRKALKDGLSIEESRDVGKLDYLHELTLQRQGIKRDPYLGELVRSISGAALAKGFGELLLCRNKAGEVVGATLYLYYRDCGYYLFGANHPDYRDAYAGTLLMLENIRRCRERGINFVDVCGINSPNRGDFKTSFNAACIPYFYVIWEKPNAK